MRMDNSFIDTNLTHYNHVSAKTMIECDWLMAILQTYTQQST